MANSKYAYVKSFEVEERILPEVWIVVRLDGRCFSRFAEEHRLQKPNDERCLRLMEHSARKVLFGWRRMCFDGIFDRYWSRSMTVSSPMVKVTSLVLCFGSKPTYSTDGRGMQVETCVV